MWLLENNIKTRVEQAMSSGMKPTVRRLEQFVARRHSRGSDENPVLRINGPVAEIHIEGVLTSSPDWFAEMFGGGNTVYSDIQNAIHTAENDSTVTSVNFMISSGGGSVDGLFDTLADIQTMTKPKTAIVSGMAASAAYAIAAQADTIQASGITTSFGSIGVAIAMRVSENVVEISSTNSPKKRPDAKTETGRAAIREELDAIHELFVEAIGQGRGETVDKINANYGQGGILLAREALKRGMIDSIGESSSSTKTKAEAQQAEAQQTESIIMDLKTLKAQHPDVYSAAALEGATEERDRIEGHLTMGQTSGDMKTALKAIEDGSAMTQKLTAVYMSAAVNKTAVENNEADDAKVDEAVAEVDKTPSTEHVEADAQAEGIMADAMEMLGVEL